MEGDGGVDPPPGVSKTTVLPLYESPINFFYKNPHIHMGLSNDPLV